MGKSRGGILIGAQTLNDNRKACRVKVDTNRNDDLADDTVREILPDSSLEVLINRPSKQGRQEPLPYLLYYDAQPDGQTFLALSSNYWAAGELTINNCKMMFALLDQNEDGLFDKRDFGPVPSVGLDRDGDKLIGSFNEWLNGKQIIEACGRALLIASLEPDGSAATLVPTSLRGAQLNEPAPSFSFTTLQGKTMRSEEMKGKVVLLDFWASWCSPCIEKFEIVKQIEQQVGDGLAIIAINVDEQRYIPFAKQIIEKHKLPWPHVINGQGENDTVWKTFGGISGNGLMTPLYVLIDRSGQVRYAGHGGSDLAEVRAKIEELLRADKPATIKN